MSDNALPDRKSMTFDEIIGECYDIAAIISGADALLEDTREASDEQHSAGRLLFEARKRLMKLGDRVGSVHEVKVYA